MTLDNATVLREQYASACRSIKQIMPPGLRAAYDPEDFVGDAIIEVLANPAYSTQRGPALLIMIAKRRMIDVARSPRCRSMPLEVELTDRQPTVALAYEATELRECLLRRASDPKLHVAVNLRCQGYTSPEIAELTGQGIRTVQRDFKQFAKSKLPL
jgi:DNA-directed RNA polymerase specialized sigma24 family protein